MIIILLAVLSIAALVVLNISAERTRIKEQEELQEAIKHLPIEQQTNLLMSHLRHEAEKDLH